MSGGGELRTPPAVPPDREPCPTDDLLAAHFAAELSPEESGRIAAHLDDCDACRELAVAFQRGLRTEPDVLTPSRSGSGIPGAISIELSAPSLPGAFAGRYQLRRLIGSGGMGAVYESLDVHLQRLIALKVLRLPPDQTAERAEAANRLVREARAMAKLSHRNVVAVYDVGIHNDQVFVAMQLIDGTTLRHWRMAQPRSSRQIL